MQQRLNGAGDQGAESEGVEGEEGEGVDYGVDARWAGWEGVYWGCWGFFGGGLGG